MKFRKSNPHFEFLHKKWTGKHKSAHERFLDTHTQTLKHLTLGGVGGLMLLANPAIGAISPPSATHQLPDLGQTQDNEAQKGLASDLSLVVPDTVRPLTPSEESEVSEILSARFGMKVGEQLQGVRLNRSYGLIGGEQHLYRYPGDTVFKHARSTSDWAMYGGSGIAPGLGAWGYFTPSSSQFDRQAEERERWYIAVQTFLAPGFAENVAKYRDFFKFRKMLLVNPNTGQAVVTDIGDAGPSEWTGKSLGGSPEVMHYLGYAKGPRKGPTLYFFIDDPEDKIPLGPVSPTGGVRLVRT